MSTIVRVTRVGEFDRNFITLRRFPLQVNSGLSNAARGLYGALHTALPEWEPSINGYAAYVQLPDGKTKIATQCKELREAGYLRFKKNNDGTVEWLVTEYANDFGDEGTDDLQKPKPQNQVQAPEPKPQNRVLESGPEPQNQVLGGASSAVVEPEPDFQPQEANSYLKSNSYKLKLKALMEIVDERISDEDRVKAAKHNIHPEILVEMVNEFFAKKNQDGKVHFNLRYFWLWTDWYVKAKRLSVELRAKENEIAKDAESEDSKTKKKAEQAKKKAAVEALAKQVAVATEVFIENNPELYQAYFEAAETKYHLSEMISKSFAVREMFKDPKALVPDEIQSDLERAVAVGG